MEDGPKPVPPLPPIAWFPVTLTLSSVAEPPPPIKKAPPAPRPPPRGAAAAVGVVKAGAAVAAALGHALHGQIGERCDT
jgi:hypothetical protein